ncbi:acetate--CoA ligase [Candidatus Micrarchaeota archaeon]|nr:acetate--CoA ligase [Candidatus Micrarchaeota archaeon]
MQTEIVTKDQTKFVLQPNLKDYEALYKNFDWKNVHNEIEWFDNGELNAAYNAVDRHAKNHNKNKVALIYEAANGKIDKYTYLDLKHMTNKFANVLKKLGIVKGERVFLFLPRIPAVYASFLGTLKVGAIASTLFSAFGEEALLDRLGNSKAKAVVTTPDLKQRIDKIKDKLPDLTYIILVNNEPIQKIEGQSAMPITIDYNEEMKEASKEFEIEKTHPEDHAFLLYTSGSTGKSKGVVHAHMAVLQQHYTHKLIHDIHPEDIYWCTADHGWVTGISYGILGPLSNGATVLLYEGRFDPEGWYSALERHEVTLWYTAPTAIRMLMKAGEEITKKYNLSHLRHIYSVGEPLNPEGIRWGLKVFNLPFHDTWWQTETGSMLISNYPCMPIKLGSMGKPFPGIVAAVVDDTGQELPTNTEGHLAIKPGWPSMLRTLWGDEERYKKLFNNGWYITGDRARKDEDGYFWYIGRADDVIKTSGERVGPFEVESVLVEHPAIAEAGVIGKPDELRGEIIKAFVALRAGYTPNPELEEDIKKFVKQHLAAHAYPREIAFVDKLPKTRSGKIMRRLLRARELGLPEGDISTLED